MKENFTQRLAKFKLPINRPINHRTDYWHWIERCATAKTSLGAHKICCCCCFFFHYILFKNELSTSSLWPGPFYIRDLLLSWQTRSNRVPFDEQLTSKYQLTKRISIQSSWQKNRSFPSHWDSLSLSRFVSLFLSHTHTLPSTKQQQHFPVFLSPFPCSQIISCTTKNSDSDKSTKQKVNVIRMPTIWTSITM